MLSWTLAIFARRMNLLTNKYCQFLMDPLNSINNIMGVMKRGQRGPTPLPPIDNTCLLETLSSSVYGLPHGL